MTNDLRKQSKKERERERLCMYVPAAGTGASIHPYDSFVERKSSGFASKDGVSL